jgi:hypothetical protein
LSVLSFWKTFSWSVELFLICFWSLYFCLDLYYLFLSANFDFGSYFSSPLRYNKRLLEIFFLFWCSCWLLWTSHLILCFLYLIHFGMSCVHFICLKKLKNFLLDFILYLLVVQEYVVWFPRICWVLKVSLHFSALWLEKIFNMMSVLKTLLSCFVANHMIYSGEYSMCYLEECVLCSCCMECSVNMLDPFSVGHNLTLPFLCWFSVWMLKVRC